MPAVRTLEVRKDDLRTTRIIDSDAAELEAGEVRLEISRFAVTANNVSYAVTGDIIGYWGFFPREEGWGVVPVWGFGEVVASKCDDLPVGETLYGYFPTASHVVLRPVNVSPRGFVDGSAHRAALPGLYNQYMRTSGDPAEMKGLEDARCLYFPLFVTSFMLADHLEQNDFFGAGQVIIGSASSKTGYGLAAMLKELPERSVRIVGLTSPGNIAFTEQLGWYDDVRAYDDLEGLSPDTRTAFVDMSGDGFLRARLHTHFGENTVVSTLVGATHWEAERNTSDLPGAEPKFFFVPDHIEARDKELGRGVIVQKAYLASARVAGALAGKVEIDRFTTAEEANAIWLGLVNNEIGGSKGLIGAISSGG